MYLGSLLRSRWAITLSGILLTAILSAACAQSVVDGASQPTHHVASATAQLQRTKVLRETPHPTPSKTAAPPNGSDELAATTTLDSLPKSPAGPVRTPEPSPTVRFPAEITFLETALAFMPMDVVEFYFNNWTEIKAHYRLSYLTSESADSERERLYYSVLLDGIVVRSLDKNTLDFQAETWGWDFSDLEWEAIGIFNRVNADIYIQKLRSNFQFGYLGEQLLDMGFTSTHYRGIQIYNVPLTTYYEWMPETPPEMRTIALIEEIGLVIMSPEIESMWKVIDVYIDQNNSLSSSPPVMRAAFELIDMFGVRIDLGPETCVKFGVGQIEDYSGESKPEQLMKSQLEEWPVHPYELLAAGHVFVADTQIDIVMMYYEDYSESAADFENRENLIRYGVSPYKSVPYASQFILRSAEIEDSLMTFLLEPSPTLGDRSGWPQTVIGWITGGIREPDALFAACLIPDDAGPEGWE